MINEMLSSDINGDGRIDIITKTNPDKDIILHTQNADSTFNSFNYVNYFMAHISRLQYIDFDGDGNKDVISIDGGQNGKIQVNYNNGNGIFPTGDVVYDNTRYFSSDALITDWDKDGLWDIVYASSNKVYVHINYQNTANDTLITLYVSNASSVIGNIAHSYSKPLYLGDIDNDGDNDLIISENGAGPSAGKIMWIENTGLHSFILHSLALPGVDSYAVGDIDGDNDLDFVGTERLSFSTELRTYLFDLGTKTFVADQVMTTTEDMRKQFVLADPDSDNDHDIVFSGSIGLKWFENTNGLGSLNTDVALTTINMGATAGIVSIDFYDDGLLDFAVTAYVGGEYVIIPIINQGGNVFTPLSGIPTTSSGISILMVEDVDSDGISDIITSGVNVTGSHYPVWFRICYSSKDSIVENVCNSYTSPSGNYTWSTSNIYTDTIANLLGCDSVITINLTITTVDSSVTQNNNILTANTAGATYQWLDCDNGNAAISLATNQSFTVTTNGNYAVVVTQNSCSDTSVCMNATIVGVDELEVTTVVISPNPTNGLMTISFENKNKAVNYAITTIDGRLVLEGTTREDSIEVDLRNESNGIYFLKVNQNNTNTTYKIVKQ
ncbi:MAG: T9SS type A sorting domain-containing protein [Flavobacteriales bacterium]|nr:T9SS type A sorting domain-containing protein [Flavobacteriales bacterium]